MSGNVFHFTISDEFVSEPLFLLTALLSVARGLPLVSPLKIASKDFLCDFNMYHFETFIIGEEKLRL